MQQEGGFETSYLLSRGSGVQGSGECSHRKSYQRRISISVLV